MFINPDGYLAKFKYVEIGHYVEYNDKANVIREKSGEDPLFIEWDKVQSYVERWENTGIYTSVFRYSEPTLDSAVRLGPLYFDIDSSDTELALIESRRIANHLRAVIPDSGIEIFFTGKKGFHIECQPVTLGITPTYNPATVYRYIANEFKEDLSLSTIDFAVYEPRRMWRLSNSKHQLTGLYKIRIHPDELASLSFDEIAEIAKEPRVIKSQEPQFDIKANEWYREYTYKIEESKQKKYSVQDIINRFNTHGSKYVNVSEFEREFDPIKLFEGCPSILELWKKAETTHNLEHEERLFLCSLLTYTDEAIEYLHSILSNCDDYRYEKSQSHIDDWVRRREMGIGGRPFSCERASQAGIVCSGCETMEAKPRYEKIGDKLYPTEELSSPSPIRYAYVRKNSG